MNNSINSKILKEINNLGLYNLKKYSAESLHPERNTIEFFMNYKDNHLLFYKLLSVIHNPMSKSTFEYLTLNINFTEFIELDVYIHRNKIYGGPSFKNRIIYFNNNFYIKKEKINPIINVLLKYFDIIIKYYKDIIINRIQNINKNQNIKQLNLNNDYIILGEDKIEANKIIIKPKKSILNYFTIQKGGHKKINKKDYNVSELKSMCKNNKIKNYSKLNKDNLIKLIKNHK